MALCAGNLGSICRSALVYAEVHRGVLPVADHDPEQIEGPPWVRSAAFVGVNRAMPDRVTDPDNPEQNLQNNGSNTRGWFKLLHGGKRAYMAPRQMICPEGVGLGHQPEGPSVMKANTAGVESYNHDFDGTRRSADDAEMTEFSYSFQVNLRTNIGTKDEPIMTGRLLTNVQDPRLATVADRNPYSNDVKLVDGNAVYHWTPGKVGLMNPPIGSDFTMARLRSKTANSRNHHNRGQNVGYLDGHVKWITHSLAGADDDFIWSTHDPENASMPAEPAAGLDYGEMRPATDSLTDSLLLP